MKSGQRVATLDQNPAQHLVDFVHCTSCYSNFSAKYVGVLLLFQTLMFHYFHRLPCLPIPMYISILYNLQKYIFIFMYVHIFPLVHWNVEKKILGNCSIPTSIFGIVVCHLRRFHKIPRKKLVNILCVCVCVCVSAFHKVSGCKWFSFYATIMFTFICFLGQTIQNRTIHQLIEINLHEKHKKDDSEGTTLKVFCVTQSTEVEPISIVIFLFSLITSRSSPLFLFLSISLSLRRTHKHSNYLFRGAGFCMNS